MSDHTPQGISGGETHTSVSSFLHPGLPAGGAPELNESQGTGRKQPGEEERRGRLQGDRKHSTEAWQEGAWLVRGSSRRLQGSESSLSQTPAQLKPWCLLPVNTWCLHQGSLRLARVLHQLVYLTRSLPSTVTDTQHLH